MAIHRNGSPPCRLQLAIVIPNAPSSCCSLPSHLVRPILSQINDGSKLIPPCSRSSIRACRTVVSPHSSPGPEASQVRRDRGRLSIAHLRWLDLRHIDGRPRLARHLHDLIPGRDTAMDAGMLGAKPTESNSHQIPKIPLRHFLRDTRAPGILLHPAQGSQGRRRYVTRER